MMLCALRFGGLLVAAAPRLAGTLLLPDLHRRAADFAEALGRSGTRAATRELPLHDFPEQVLVDFGTDDRVVQVARPDALSGEIFDFDLHGWDFPIRSRFRRRRRP